MDFHTYLLCFIVGLLGIMFQILLKIIGLQKRAKAGNADFKPIDYFKDDWATILLSFVTLLFCIFAADEILNWKPAIINFVKVAFFFVGYTGSSILNVLLSISEKKIMATIDKKTNEADSQINKQ